VTAAQALPRYIQHRAEQSQGSYGCTVAVLHPYALDPERKLCSGIGGNVETRWEKARAILAEAILNDTC